ncbi:MAG: Flp pilus assembly protein CpaB [Chloroflexi bacterium]|nr:Flp pilus assembly protein CpaB [Chloroflexota bacterium]
MKRIPILIVALIGLALLFAWYQSQPVNQAQPVIVAANGLPAGHVIQATDLKTVRLDPDVIPEGAFSQIDALIGQPVGVTRTIGDIITQTHLGEVSLPLYPGERAIGISLSDSGGLAGLLQAGDYVDVTAVMLRTEGSSNVYSKVVAEDLRVIYVSPDFRALELNPEAQATAQASGSSYATTQKRSARGTVNLAVPIDATVVSYVFADAIGHQSVTVSLLDLLPALDHSTDVEMSLLMSNSAAVQDGPIYSSGVFLPDLVVRPDEHSATPTPVMYLQTTPTP